MFTCLFTCLADPPLSGVQDPKGRDRPMTQKPWLRPCLLRPQRGGEQGQGGQRGLPFEHARPPGAGGKGDVVTHCVDLLLAMQEEFKPPRPIPCVIC